MTAERAGLTVADVLAATSGELRGAPSPELASVSIDSRAIELGDIFVAIKGECLDGHDFVEAALRAGAGLAVVSRVTPEMEEAGPLLVVADPLGALEDLGRYQRQRSGAQIVAVTG